MGVTLFVDRLISEDAEGEDLERLEGMVADLNKQLTARKLPNYEDSKELPGDYQYWNAMLSNECAGNFYSMVEGISRQEAWTGELKAVPNYEEKWAIYVPVEFTGVLPSEEDEDRVYVSSHELKTTLEELAGSLELPLERFKIDYSGEGEDEGEAWSKVIGELREQGAACTKLNFSFPVGEESVHEMARDFGMRMGVDEEESLKILLKNHGGSMEGVIEAIKNEQPSSEDICEWVIHYFVNFYHGCLISLKTGLCFQVG